MLTRKDIEDLGWTIEYNAIVIVAYKFNYRLYYSDPGRLTIHRCWNHFLEFEDVYKGDIKNKEQLKQIMEDNNI